MHCNFKERIVNQLALAGYKPKDVSAVILSHLHWDHCSNLHLFDHAEIYFNRSELKENPNRPSDISIKKPHFVDKDSEVFPGIAVITLPGHTVGMLGIVVHLKEDGTLIFASDAIYARGNYGPPAKASGTLYDSLSYFESIEKVRKLGERYKAKVTFSHDLEFFETMKSRRSTTDRQSQLEPASYFKDTRFLTNRRGVPIYRALLPV